MITVTGLARGHASFWAEITPWINPYTVHINAAHVERRFPPIDVRDAPEFRAINNTIAFFVFVEMQKGNDSTTSFSNAEKKAFSFLKHLPRNNLDRYSSTKNDIKIIEIQSDRLKSQYAAKDPVINPYFPGCGVLLSSEGDIYYQDSLAEVKAGERELSSSDIKQLLVYGALNAQSDKPLLINKFELFNPRQGVIFSISVNELCSNISDKSKEEIFNEICSYGENIALTSR